MFSLVCDVGNNPCTASIAVWKCWIHPRDHASLVTTFSREHAAFTLSSFKLTNVGSSAWEGESLSVGHREGESTWVFKRDTGQNSVYCMSYTELFLRAQWQHKHKPSWREHRGVFEKLGLLHICY